MLLILFLILIFILLFSLGEVAAVSRRDNLPVPSSLFPIPYSLFPIPYSLFPYSLVPAGVANASAGG